MSEDEEIHGQGCHIHGDATDHHRQESHSYIVVFSGIFTSEAASIGNTRTRWESSASEGNTVAGSPANVINVKSVTPVPL